MEASVITSRFGAAVRSRRRHLGFSQEKLAERAELHRTYIADVEGGARNVSLKSIERLARALKVSVAALLMQTGDPAAGTELAGGPSATGECVDILMVEDDLKDVELTLQAFKRARITNSVHVVHDGQEALDFLFRAGRFAHRRMQGLPHLILLDLKLPKIGGMEVLRRIKADQRTLSIPVVVLTGSRDRRELAECQRLGAETHIVKPVDFQTLGEATPRLNLDWALLKPPKAKTCFDLRNFSL
jgi:CheY-like chemotaxis protein/DNA-binding XRE family transcriptional regulator